MQEIEYNDKFKMYFVCKQSNPKFDLKIYSNTIVINFNITMSSLENQLLDIVFESVDSQLAADRSKLHKSRVLNKERLRELENNLLSYLSIYETNLLNDLHSVELLRCTRNETIEIHSKSNVQENMFTYIEIKREEFRLISTKAATLFFVLADMSAINIFYQYILIDFIDVFKCILTSVPHEDLSLDEFSSRVITGLYNATYKFKSIGILAKDKLLFFLRIIMELEYCDGKISREEIDFLLKPTPTSYFVEDMLFDWLPSKQYNDILLLVASLPDLFHDLLINIRLNKNKWQAWYYSEKPETVNRLELLDTILTDFQVLRLRFLLLTYF